MNSNAYPRTNSSGVSSTISAIPLHDPHAVDSSSSIGTLVKEASAQISTLARSEIALAKLELVSQIRRGAAGSAFFIAALVVLLFSSFFFFFFLGELLSGLVHSRTIGFGIVFFLMIVFAVVLAVLGFLQVRRIRAPKKTIESIKGLGSVLPAGSRDSHRETA